MANRIRSEKTMNKEKNTMKKLVSMLLALSMVLSIVCMIPVQVGAIDLPGIPVEEEEVPPINKTATELVNDITNVTLSVPGEAEDYTSDVVFIIGNGPAHNYTYIVDTIHKILVAADGSPTQVKVGMVGFANTTEDEIVLPLTPMVDTVPGNKVADYRLAERYNDGKQYTETVEEYAIREAEYEAKIANLLVENPQLASDMEFIIARALQEASKVYDGINLESALITARDMLIADETVPADRKHMIVVSTGLTYWFDNDDGKGSFIVRNNGGNQPQHVNYKYWLQHRNGTTSTGSGYRIPNSYKTNDNTWEEAWNAYWLDIVSWIAKDQDKYVYSVRDNYGAYIKREGKNSTITDPQDLALVNTENGKYVLAPNCASMDSVKTEAGQHAVGYERAQYEAWVVYKQMETSLGESFTTALGDTVNGLGFNCYAIAIGAGDATPEQADRWLTNNQIGYNFMRMLGGENTVNYVSGDTSFFKAIENKILYKCGVGSYVEDIIGYHPEKGNFEFLTDVENLVLVKGETTYQASVADQSNELNPYTDREGKLLREGAAVSYAFTAPGATEPTFWLDYFVAEEGNPGSEKFIWTFGENVSRFIPVSLTYALKLTDKATEPDGKEIEIETNIEATLDPKDSNGEWGDPEEFPVPEVDYTVENKTEIAVVIALGPGIATYKTATASDPKGEHNVIKLLAPLMESGKYNVRLGLVGVETQQQILLNVNDDKALLNAHQDWEAFVRAELQAMSKLHVGPTGMEGSIRRAMEMMDALNQNTEIEIEPENMYFYMLATGRSYWFETEEGKAGTVMTKITKNGKDYAVWNERSWKIARINNSNVYALPAAYHTDADDAEDYARYFADFSKWSLADGYKYVYIVNCGTENNANFENWRDANNTELRAGANNTTGDRYAYMLETDAGLPGTGFFHNDTTASDLFNGKHNSMTNPTSSGAQHALNYELAQYEAYTAWIEALNKGYNCISVCTESVSYQNYSPYLTVGSWALGTKSPQIGHSYMDYLARANGTQTESALVFTLLDNNGKYMMEENFFPPVIGEDDQLLDYANPQVTYSVSKRTPIYASAPMVEKAPVIATQPASEISLANNAPIALTVTAQNDANGSVYNYEWFVKEAKAAEYKSTGITANTFSAVMNPAYNGMKLKCVVSSKINSKLSVESDEITLKYIPTELRIIAQSDAAVVANINEYAYVFVNAQGEGLSYRWFVKDAGSAGWNISSLNSPVYAAKMNAAVNGRQVYCVVIDAAGKYVESNVFTLTCVSNTTASTELAITNTLPQEIKVGKHETATVTIEAQGEGLTYEWYFQNANGNNWSKASENGNTYSLAMTNGRSGRKVYCIVKDANGKSVTSATVTLTMEGAK